MTLLDLNGLSCEDLFDFAGVPYDRGFVSLREIVDAINRKNGTDMIASDQIGLYLNKIDPKYIPRFDPENPLYLVAPKT